ncbi:hypothetical protein C1701_08115 [Actinoalloteichus sp. AHMU CJ021]|nr:hypothetical protein C1701_08115 [Actinoalloteichus sp. AHMU CJ021]
MVSSRSRAGRWRVVRSPVAGRGPRSGWDGAAHLRDAVRPAGPADQGARPVSPPSTGAGPGRDGTAIRGFTGAADGSSPLADV